jgi:hypothetical protein
VIDERPSPTKISGLTILGDKSGYDSIAAAQKALGSGAGCEGRSTEREATATSSNANVSLT